MAINLLQIPYNVERILLMAADLNTSKVGEIMRKFENDNGTQIPKDLLDRVHDVIVGKLMEIWNFVRGPLSTQKAFHLMISHVKADF